MYGDAESVRMVVGLGATDLDRALMASARADNMVTAQVLLEAGIDGNAAYDLVSEGHVHMTHLLEQYLDVDG